MGCFTHTYYTDLKLSLAIDIKMRAGREKVPTNVLRPNDSVCEIRLHRPATYLYGTQFKNITCLPLGFARFTFIFNYIILPPLPSYIR